jgi:hypothetical protein
LSELKLSGDGAVAPLEKSMIEKHMWIGARWGKKKSHCPAVNLTNPLSESVSNIVMAFLVTAFRLGVLTGHLVPSARDDLVDSNDRFVSLATQVGHTL